MILKRQPFSPKAIVEGKYSKAKMVDEDEKEYYVLYDEINKEVVDFNFIEQYFKIESIEELKDKEIIKLTGKTSLIIRPKYFPQKRYGEMGPIKTYEGFEIEKQFIRVETFLQLFDLVEE